MFPPARPLFSVTCTDMCGKSCEWLQTFDVSPPPGAHAPFPSTSWCDIRRVGCETPTTTIRVDAATVGDSIVKSHGCVLSQCQVVQLMTRYPPSPQMQGTVQGTCPSISSSHQGSHTLICYFSMERQYPHNIKKFIAYFGCMVRTEHTRDEHGETDNDHWHS